MPEDKETRMTWKGFISSIINSWPLIILICLLLFHGEIREKIKRMSSLKIDESGLLVMFDKAFMNYTSVEAVAASKNIQSMEDVNFLKQAALLTPVYRSVLVNSGVDEEALTILDETERKAKDLLSGIATRKEIKDSVDTLASEGIKREEIGTPQGDRKIAELIERRRSEGRDIQKFQQAKMILENEKKNPATAPEVDPDVLKKLDSRELRRTAVPSPKITRKPPP